MVGGAGYESSSQYPFSWDRKDGLMSATHPGYKSKWEHRGEVMLLTDYEELTWVWTPGCPDLSRAGYIAGDKEGNFIWKAGVPDFKRIGIISGAKEGEFVVAPGFQKQKDGKICWTPGLSHPDYPGIVSTKKMFSWMPDDQHIWANETPEAYARAHRYSFPSELEDMKSKLGNPASFLKTEEDCEVVKTIPQFAPYVKLFGKRTIDMVVQE